MVVEVIKWEPEGDESRDIIAYKHDAEDFSCNAQLLVAPSQVALFVNEGEVIPFLPGHYTLSDSNNSPFKFINRWRTRHSDGVSSFHCQIYYINMIFMTDLRFGTINPIQMADPEEAVNIHVRAAGLFGAHINNDDKDGKDVIKFFTKVVGTKKAYTKTELADYLRGKIVEKVTDLLGQAMVASNIGILKVSAFYSHLSAELQKQMTPYFADFGIIIDNFSFMTINVPDEDLKAVNEKKIAAKQMDLESEALARKRAREGYTFQQESAYDVLKTAAGNQSSMGGGMMNAGMGIGMGVGLGTAFGGAMNGMAQNAMGGFTPQQGEMNMPQQNMAQPQQTAKCSACGAILQPNAKFCLECGQKVGSFCPKCGAQISPNAKFCPECGEKLVKVCPQCNQELPPDAKFCPECGNKF